MKKMSSKEIMTIIKKNIIVIVVFALVGALGFLGYAKHRRTTEYIAQCNIIIGHNSNYSAQKSKQINTDLNRMKSYEDIVEDPVISRQAHHYLSKSEKKELTTKMINHGTKVTTSNGSLVMTISGRAKSAKLATDMVNAAAKATRKRLPEIIPDVGKVTVISYAKTSDAVSHTRPSYKKYGIVGFAFGALVGMVIAFVWTSWRHLLPEQ